MEIPVPKTQSSRTYKKKSCHTKKTDTVLHGKNRRTHNICSGSLKVQKGNKSNSRKYIYYKQLYQAQLKGILNDKGLGFMMMISSEVVDTNPVLEYKVMLML
ncbi:hypothetical protein GDO81_005715 [Engystomops pustulosus]|uniref:Uncharacterized protein n=1 Tax=Engystomops pustulosus TaxID=76066 RepID=A0AAV7CR74_ENGPU|nr:hypothetical protein GDO81_005715 [Engystomops pustulosus]